MRNNGNLKIFQDQLAGHLERIVELEEKLRKAELEKADAEAKAAKAQRIQADLAKRLT